MTCLAAGDPRLRPGDWVTIGRTGGAEESNVAGWWESPDEAAGIAEELAKVPGAWRKRQSDPDRLEPEPGLPVVWELMYPEGHPRTGIVGYAVHWHRRTP